MDRIEIYKKLTSVKPFFQDVKRHITKKITHTERQTTLVKGAGGVWFEQTVEGGSVISGDKRPMFIAYI